MGLSAAPATCEIDSAHSGAQFAVRHMMISNVRGAFSKVAGTAVGDPQNPAVSSLQATVDVSTIDTRDARRDEHLKAADFFDTARYPAMQFKSKEFRCAAGQKLAVRGDLTIHGVTKGVVLDVDGPTAEVKDPWGNTRLGATATTKINREDFGLTWNQALETGGVVVGEDVTITLNVELVRKAAANVSQR